MQDLWCWNEVLLKYLYLTKTDGMEAENSIVTCILMVHILKKIKENFGILTLVVKSTASHLKSVVGVL